MKRYHEEQGNHKSKFTDGQKCNWRGTKITVVKPLWLPAMGFFDY